MVRGSLQKAAGRGLFLLLQLGANNAVHAKEIQGRAAPGNAFLVQFNTLHCASWDYENTFDISSNVPVTVQRYNYDDTTGIRADETQPIRWHDIVVLVTSDCENAAADNVPRVTWGDGSIDIEVEGAPANAPFLETSSYHATWTYRTWDCYNPGTPSSGASSLRPAFPFSSLLCSLLWGSSSAVWAKGEDEEEEVDPAKRILQQTPSNCTVNAEVLLAGCYHAVNVTAPSIRVMDATLENMKETANSDKCTTDLETDILFQDSLLTTNMESLHIARSICRPLSVEGRPYVDSTGSALQAPLRMIEPVEAGKNNGWLTHETTLLEATPPAANNRTTNRHQLLLGRDWTERALAEHASIASFAAFSIELMTNGAPSDLVEDSLLAALDEVRHARTSFDIASRLLGKEVGPGPLPASTHEFAGDIKRLGLAVANEGCVDETLSALAAAVEVEFIDVVLTNGREADGSKYAGIDRKTLVWIQEELRTIAVEESAHAALAWRTFEWVCSIDSEACNAIKRKVLSEENLERALLSRGDMGYDTLNIIRMSWKKIYAQEDPRESMKVCLNEAKLDGMTFIEEIVDRVVQSI